jgi:hypothetical protein
MERKNDFGTRFESEAGEKGFFAELWEFLGHNKKYWMIPIIIALLAAGLLILFSSAASLPFIYTLF